MVCKQVTFGIPAVSHPQWLVTDSGFQGIKSADPASWPPSRAAESGTPTLNPGIRRSTTAR
jgi:hypothetical protein